MSKKKSVQIKSRPVAKSFHGRLERIESRLGWVIIRVPVSITKVWGTRGRLKVKGEINGFAFRTSLFPSRKGDHVMLINKRMQAGAQVGLGMSAHFRLEPDLEVRKATVPVELKRALSQDRSVRRWFDNLSYSMRKWISDWISQPKGAEARERRAEQIAERLMATMEAERELPPLLQIEFAREPRARAGWERMSPSRRRGELMAIFYYQSPEARARRIAKTIEAAVACAERSRA
jgi:uncharacterized protein YdeI (YjbR/CyaY-like superfamily)